MGDGCLGERFAGEDVMNFHRRVLPWNVIAARSRHLDHVTRHVLALLREDAGDVGCSTRTECDEQQLHWRGRCRSVAVGVERQCVT